METQLNEAEILAQKILAKKPDDPDALNILGLILLQQERFGDAVNHFRHAVEIQNDCTDIRDNLVRAVALFAKKSLENNNHNLAEKVLRSTISSLPEQTELYCHLSFILSHSRNYDEALVVSETALGLDKENPHSHDVRGVALHGLGRSKDALHSFRRALKINPHYISARVNMSSALLELNEYEVAIEHLERATKIEPRNPQIFNNLGLAHAGRAQYRESEEHLRIAIKFLPKFAEAHFNLSRVLLMQGKYQEGWQENEWRWKCQSFPSTWRDFPYARWQGEPVKGKTVLVWSEQGIGDEIMFASIIPDLLADGARLILECGERLVPIFNRSFEGASVVSRKNPPNKLVQQAQVDYQLPMASLCNYYRNSREAFHKAKGHYLNADPTRLIKLRHRYLKPEKKPLVGICWRSGNPIAGAERSAPLEHWDKILLHPNCTFVSLQYGEVKADLEAVKKRLGVQVHHDELIDPLKDAEDWFAQVAAMDLVISVDNSTIQVSGSQGIKTWVLLSSLPEWRFGVMGSGHDWHVTAQVYRQKTEGHWEPVFDMLASDLGTWLADTEFNL